MAKLSLNNLTSGFASTATLNANFDAIEAALENTLSRDGTTPNQMQADLDMNSNGILNLATLDVESLLVNGVPVTSPELSVSEVPAQTGHNGKFLQTNGTVVSWQVPDADEVSYDNGSTGSVAREVGDKLRERVSVKDFGAVGDGVTDDTAAIQAALDSMTPTTAELNASTNNRQIFFPTGTYKITSTIAPENSLSQYTLLGEGRRASVIKWEGSSGTPMFYLVNARGVRFDSLGIFGNSSSKPTYGIQFHKQNLDQVGTAAPAFCTIENCLLGGDSSDMLGTGVVFTATDDANNEQCYFRRNIFSNITDYAISLEHSNSLLHIIDSCQFDNIGVAAINNIGAASTQGGSYTATHCHSGNCGAPLRVGKSYHPISIFGWVSEGDSDILLMPNSVSGTDRICIDLHGFSFKATSGTPNLTFDASSGSFLNMFAPTIIGSSGMDLSFPTTGSRVNIYGGRLTLNSLTYNNEVTLNHVYQEAGAPTYTNVGSGTLYLERSDGTSRLDVLPTHTSGTEINVSGISTGVILVNLSTPTTVTTISGARVGQEITLVPINGNLTVAHGTGTNQPRLQGASNFAMASTNSLTIKRMDVTVGNSWIETSRKT